MKAPHYQIEALVARRILNQPLQSNLATLINLQSTHHQSLGENEHTTRHLKQC